MGIVKLFFRMAYLLNSMWGGNGGYGFPFWRLGMMLFWLGVFLVIAYLIYQDANNRGMNGLLWGILVLIPMAGILFLILYIIIRETGGLKTVPGEKSPMDILNSSFIIGYRLYIKSG
jgi:putative membrane protein